MGRAGAVQLASAEALRLEAGGHIDTTTTLTVRAVLCVAAVMCGYRLPILHEGMTLHHLCWQQRLEEQRQVCRGGGVVCSCCMRCTAAALVVGAATNAQPPHLRPPSADGCVSLATWHTRSLHRFPPRQAAAGSGACCCLSCCQRQCRQLRVGGLGPAAS